MLTKCSVCNCVHLRQHAGLVCRPPPLLYDVPRFLVCGGHVRTGQERHQHPRVLAGANSAARHRPFQGSSVEGVSCLVAL